MLRLGVGVLPRRRGARWARIAGAVLLGLGLVAAGVPAGAAAPTAPARVRVSLTPATAGATATYTVSLTARNALAAGSGSITLDASAGAVGTAFPSVAADYTVRDLSARAKAVAVTGAVVPAHGLSAMTFTVPVAVRAGDRLEVTVAGVTNPLQPSGVDHLDVHTSADPRPTASRDYSVLPAPVSIGEVTATVYPNPQGSGAFDGTQLDKPQFTERFPLLDFNPPAAVQGACANAAKIGVNAGTRPLTAVIAQPDGRCVAQPLQVAGHQAGEGALYQFGVVFTATLYVAHSGNLTFDIYSDDGWQMGFGHGGGGQPRYVSGSMKSPPQPAVTAARHYPLAGAYDTPSTPTLIQVVVRFPAAGTYPLEVDYSECCGGTLAFVAGTQFGSPIPPAQATIPLGNQSSMAAALVPPGVALGSLRRDAAAMGIAVGGVLLLTFPAELFNSTLEENYDEIRAWWERRFRLARRLAGWLAARGTERAQRGGVIAVLLLGSFLGALLDPRFGLNLSSLESYLGMVGSMVFSLALAGLVAFHYRRRRGRTQEYALHAIPAGLLVAALCVFVSRLVHFQPGYLYGVLCGVVFSEELLEHEEAHIVALSALANLGAVALLWLLWSVFNPPATHAGLDMPLVVLDDFLGASVTLGLTGTVFSLLPLEFLPGGRLASWHRGAWSATFLTAVFGLIAIVVWPRRLVPAPPVPLITAIALFAAFGLGSVAFWWYFQRRRKHGGDGEHGEGGSGAGPAGGG